MNVFIYTLAHPVTNEVRYVGKTTNVQSRLAKHVSKISEKNHKSAWIKSLLRMGLRPKIETLEVIENSNDEDWQESERFWISYLRFLGCRLTNLDSGGFLGRCHSPETRQKISAAHKGRIKSPGHLRNISMSCTGRISPRKGVSLSLETRAKISRGLMGNVPANKGGHHSPETRAKMSKSARARWDRIRLDNNSETHNVI